MTKARNSFRESERRSESYVWIPVRNEQCPFQQRRPIPAFENPRTYVPEKRYDPRSAFCELYAA